MAIFAEFVLNPGGILAWAAVGLLAGWLAGRVMSGGGYGVVTDVVLGLVGALVGGFVFSQLTGGTGEVGGTGFWGSVGVAFIGACVLLAAGRFVGMGRRT